MTLQQEQNFIISFLNPLNSKHGRNWYKFKGDVTNRVVQEFLQKHVKGYKVVGPAAFIEGITTEFDILIVDAKAVPMKYTNCFPRAKVRLIIEIKKHGFYYKKVEAEEKISQYVRHFEDVGLPYLYLTVQESRKIIEATKNVLHDRAFFLQISGGRPIDDEWERFVNKVLNLLNTDG